MLHRNENKGIYARKEFVLTLRVQFGNLLVGCLTCAGRTLLGTLCASECQHWMGGHSVCFYQAYSLLSLLCRWSKPDQICMPYVVQLRKHGRATLPVTYKSHEISAIYMLSEPVRSSCAFFFALKWRDCNVIIFKPNSLSKSDVNPLSPKLASSEACQFLTSSSKGLVMAEPPGLGGSRPLHSAWQWKGKTFTLQREIRPRLLSAFLPCPIVCTWADGFRSLQV